MADERRAPRSLKEQSADQIRNAQRGGANSPIDPERDGGPEGNATLRRVWSEPGGEAYNYRQAKTGQTSNAGFDGHDELTAAETPETTKHLNDATLKPEDRDATAEAIARATAARGPDRPGDGEAASHLGQDDRSDAEAPKSGAAPTPTTHTPRNPGGVASSLQPGGTVPGGGPGASAGSIGTGGGSTGGAPSGGVKKAGV